MTQQPPWADQGQSGGSQPPSYGTQPPTYGQQPGQAYPPQPAPQYGSPYAQYQGPPPPRTNTMAIIALVAAFVFAPAGLVLGLMALKEINRTGEEGRGLALAGAIIGGIATGFIVLAFVLPLVFWIFGMGVVSTF